MNQLARTSIDGFPEWLLYVAAVLSAVGVIVGSINRWVVAAVVRTLNEKLDHKLDPLEERLGKIQAEVTYNGGSSLKDRVRSNNEQIAVLQGQIDTLTAVIAAKPLTAPIVTPTPNPEVPNAH